jgi:hypothetical protein
VIWVLLAVVIVLLATVAFLLTRQQRTRRLREGFGPEYDRVVGERGDQRAAERELVSRRQRHDQFEIRSLEPAARSRYIKRWETVQRLFVDEPGAAVDEADMLVQQVMHDRGYPIEDDFEQRAADISVQHPVVVENYRAAHEISARARRGQANTEQLRQSLVHFRALFDDLLTEQQQSHEPSDDGRELSVVNQTTTRSR